MSTKAELHNRRVMRYFHLDERDKEQGTTDQFGIALADIKWLLEKQYPYLNPDMPQVEGVL